MTPKRLTHLILLTLIAIMSLTTSTEAAQFLFRPELIVSGAYNDNIYLTPDNEQDDFITTAGLGLTGQIVGRTAGLELNYTPTYSTFADNSDLDYWRHTARLLVYKQLGRNTRFEFTNDYLETEDPTDEAPDYTPDDPTQGAPIETDPNRRGRNRYRTYSADASLRHQFGTRDNIETAVRFNYRVDIDTPISGTAEDYTEVSPRLGLEYWFTQRWGMEADGFHSNRTYDERNDREEYTGYMRLLHAFTRHVSGYLEYRHTELDYDRDEDPTVDIDYKLYEPAIGFRWEFQEDARFTLSVGYLFQDLKGVEDDDDYGWLVNSEIAKRWSFRRSYLELIGGSGYQIADRGVEDLGLNIYYTGRATIGYNFSTRATGELHGGYRYDDYPDETPDRQDQLWDAGATLRYQALQWMNIELTYSYRDRQSDLATNEYVENRVFLGVVMAPATPFRLN